MELSEPDNRLVLAQAIKRRDGAMRDILGMGSDPVGAEEERPHKPQLRFRAQLSYRLSLW